jgi:AAA domain/UvrD-like helicase C-terminal domain
MVVELNLTPEQSAVANVDPDVRQLVIAGPGTGKTHTLVGRLVYLVEECGLAPGQEILVLSFTRNAVKEIRMRVRADGGDTAYINARTFDSFATRMLANVEPDGTWRTRGYDGRIAAFIDLLRNRSDELMEYLGDFRHILVDETQDLVAERSEMVKALLTAADYGFTLFGDPAQAIYDYQQRNGHPAEVFTDWAQLAFPRLVVRRLTENHRVKGDGAGVALWAGPMLASRQGGPEFHERVRETFRRLHPLPAASSLRGAGPDASNAIVCRTNGQALLISEELHDSGVDHVLQGETTAAPVKPWLARALCGLDTPVITKGDLQDLLFKCGVESTIDPDEAWRALRSLGRSGRTVDLSQVTARFASGWVPDELVQKPTAGVIVSSIHRAKGQEFERVIVVADPDGHGEEEPETIAEESRILYVAMTRASTALFRLDPPTRWGLFFSNGGDRWVIRGRKFWSRMGIQLLGDDVDWTTPAAGETLDARATQDYLWAKVRSGDEVVLRARPGTVSSDRPAYQILHNEHCIGRTSESFRRVLGSELVGSVESWPSRITGVRVSTVESVVGTRAEAERTGLGGPGFWLAVRLEGLGRLDWSHRIGDEGSTGTGSTRPMPDPLRGSSTRTPTRSAENRRLWRRLQAFADAGDVEGIRRELPDAWSHQLDNLSARARRAGVRL